MSQAIPFAFTALAPIIDQPASSRPSAPHLRFMLWLVSKAGALGGDGSWLSRYGTVVAALAVATVARLLLDPVLESRAPYGMYLIAVLFVAWRAGLGPALATVCCGALLGRYLFDAPRGSLTFVTESSQASLLMTLTIGTVAAFLCESLRVTASDNRRLYELARQADARKDEFLASLAHELRNPLTPIRNAIHLLDSVPDRDPRLMESHQIIGRHAEHLIRLVNDLLDVARITQGKIELQPAPVDLQTIVNGAVEVVRPLITEKRQHLHVVLPAEKVHLRADAVRLTQVLTNLLQNAAKYTGQAGHVWLSLEMQSDQVVIRVRDTGIGIPPDMCLQIFNLFAQVPQAIEHSQGGLGIGLTLVRTLVQLHGGTVEAKSPGVGLGSEFIVRLPASASGANLQAPEAVDQLADQSQHGAALRILVVDDSPAIARSLEMVLTDWKHVVKTSCDAFAALEAARTFKPDLILTDLGMPGMNGYQFAKELRRLGGMQNVVLIAVSGYGEESDQRRSREAGFTQHLVKPVDLAELKQIVASCRRI
jgi:signal transduction histidine kinase